MAIESIDIKHEDMYNPEAEVKSKEEYTKEVVEKATLDELKDKNLIDKNNLIEIENIFNDDGAIIIKTKETSKPIGYNTKYVHNIPSKYIRVPREVMKKLIYDLYLKG